MPIKSLNNSAPTADEDIQLQRGENEAMVVKISSVTGRTSALKTSVPIAMEAAGDATTSSAENAARREMTAKAKRRRQPLQEDEEDDILPKKNSRMAKNKNRVTIESKECEEDTSSSTASTSDEEELIPQKGYPNTTQHGCLSSLSMPNYVTAYSRFAENGHAYRDFANYVDEGGAIDTSTGSENWNFPANLHAMLSNDQYSHIISWMPHGRAWRVNNRNLFLIVEEATLGIPDYPSFMRQLSEWGFKMMYQTGPDYGCYYHECFLRGHPQLTALMMKTEEPDFYAMAKQNPLVKADMSKEDTERVLFLANVALEYSGCTDQKESSYGQSQDNEMPAKTAPKDPSLPSRKKKKSKSKRKKKSQQTPNETVVPELEDLPPQSEDDPLIITTRLNALMERTHLTQKQLETYDKQNGLPRSHAQTMVRSSRSRSQFQEVLKNGELRKMGER